MTNRIKAETDLLNIHSGTIVIHSVPIGNYLLKQQNKENHLQSTEGKEGRKCNWRDEKPNTSYLEKNKEGVKLKPSKLHLSTMFFLATSCQAHMGCARAAGMFPGICKTGNKSSTRNTTAANIKITVKTRGISAGATTYKEQHLSAYRKRIGGPIESPARQIQKYSY